MEFSRQGFVMHSEFQSESEKNYSVTVIQVLHHIIARLKPMLDPVKPAHKIYYTHIHQNLCILKWRYLVKQICYTNLTQINSSSCSV